MVFGRSVQGYVAKALDEDADAMRRVDLRRQVQRRRRSVDEQPVRSGPLVEDLKAFERRKRLPKSLPVRGIGARLRQLLGR